MFSEKMLALGKESSVIREIFEYGRKRKAEIGADRVFDFSLGNPSIPAPPSVEREIRRLLDTREPTLLHGYTSAAGAPEAREAVARAYSAASGLEIPSSLVYMACGAAAALTSVLGALICPGDEVILLSPFFPEYRVFAEKAGAAVVVVPTAAETFLPDVGAIGRALTDRTKAILLNSPNNPTGVIYPEGVLRELAALLEEKKRETGRPVFLISDEPYRKLAYGKTVPFPAALYPDTVVCSSFSKSLSLPGERIGYVIVSPACAASRDLFAAVCGAARSLGYVCAPSLMQYVIASCADGSADLAVYAENRRLLTEGLSRIGYSFAPPDGAFYLFLKAPDGDAAAFCERAKKKELLLVPGNSFGSPDYVRIAYCVKKETILGALPAFEALFAEYETEKRHD